VIGLGAASLLLAFLACLYAAGASVWGAVRGDRRLVDSGRRAIYALLALLTLSVVVIEAAFLRSDFSVELVADHSSTTTPTLYKLTAVWSSQAGSLLFWAWVLAIFSSVVLLATHNRHREVAPWATAVLAGIGAFFVGLMLLADGAYPFARLDPAPIEGVGLNPLLRHPAMAIHPPMLYSGYVGFAIPFAFAIGALITRRLDASWIRSTRRFALLAWAFLGLGLILGSRWSYMELGWGGYWGWDPVENAALMPWIAGTAFLHSIMVQEKRGMLRVWNVSLVVATFALALVGTLLVRSGILESIHAFGASTVGGPLLGLIAVVVAGSAALIVSRLDDLRSEKRIDSLLSREAVFLVNNLLLLGICAVVLWGTFFPLISEAVTGERSSLAAPWFQRYVPPLAIALVLFTGIGPLLAWRRVSAGRALGLLWRPAAAAAIVAAALVALTDAASEPLALALFALAAFALAALVQEFASGAAARRALSGGSRLRALVAMVSTNRRRYGGYIVHAGIAILFIGAAASSSFRASHDVRMRPGGEDVGRRLRRLLRAAHGLGRRARAAAHARGRPRGPEGRRALRNASPLAQLLLLGGAGRQVLGDPQLLRGQRDQRGRTPGGPDPRHLDRDAPRPRTAGADDRRGRPQARAPRAEPAARRSARPADDQLPPGPGDPGDHRALHRELARGDLPHQLEPAHPLVLARRGDRGGRRRDRDLARAGGEAATGLRRLRGARGPGALPGLIGPSSRLVEGQRRHQASASVATGRAGVVCPLPPNRRSRSEFDTTLTEERAIAAEAITG